MDIQRAVAAYLKLRDMIDETKDRHKQELKELTTKQAKVGEYLDRALTKVGVENVKTDMGTAFKATKDSVKVANKAEFSQFIVDRIKEDGIDALYLLTLSAAKNAIKDYMEEHEDELPPGIEYRTWHEIQVRRS